MTALEPIGEAAAQVCGLPTTPRMRYWKPAEALAPYISGYHLYAVETAPGALHRDVFQPAWGNLRIRLTDGSRWRVRVREGKWLWPGRVTLFGPSSAVTWSESETGLVVGAGIRPRGWPRLFAGDAKGWADRIGDCPALGSATSEALHEAFCGIHEEDAVPGCFDALFADAMRPRGRDDEAIGRMEAALLDPEVKTVGELADTAGLSVRTLERLARRAFGFTPKLLLRRARFLRSLHAIRRVPAADRTTAIDPGYTDYSHFVRDSHAFLGMSPQAFLKLDNPLLKQSLQLRDQVLGAPAQALAEPGASE